MAMSVMPRRSATSIPARADSRAASGPSVPHNTSARMPWVRAVAAAPRLRDRLLVQGLGLMQPARLGGGVGRLRQDPPPFAVPGREEGKCLTVVLHGPGDVQGHGPISRHDQEAAGGLLQLRAVL